MQAIQDATSYPNEKRHQYNTLGAVLYRAGQFDAAIGRLKHGIGPLASVYRSLAHIRLGDRGEARRWLDKSREGVVARSTVAVWDELELRLLQTESEAVILYDPIFPADPFAH